jgi:acyl-homoserine-lactone acylase
MGLIFHYPLNDKITGNKERGLDFLSSPKRVIYALLLVLLVLPAITYSQDTPDVEKQAVDILWDTWGIPHIYGTDNESVFYGFGWTQMHNHGDLILRLYAEARGESAQYLGEAALENDVYMHTLGVPTRSQALYDAQPDDIKHHIDSFTAGINAYASAHPEHINMELQEVLPVRSTDVMGAWLRLLIFFQSNPRSPVMLQAQQWGSDQIGSNGWAVAPGRSASGNALLLINPHLPWGNMFITMEAQLISPEVNIYGAAFVGLPVMAYGFNRDLGWAMTVNPIDNVDLYELTLVDEGHYLLDGEIIPLDAQEITVQVRTEDGGLRPHSFVVAQSVHGPIVAQGEGKLLALRIAGIERGGILGQLWEMAQAENLDDFQAALGSLQLPMFNILYADRAGNIMHVFNGLVPKHDEGDWVSWQTIQPGDDSALIWDEYHTYDELPKVINPSSGWLQNANEPPWTNTLPPVLDPNNFPAYMTAPPSMPFRSQSSARMLAEDDSITFDEMVAYKHSTFSELGARVLDDLLILINVSSDRGLEPAAEVLRNWDGRTDATSRGGVLFAEWWARYQATASARFTTPYDFTAEPFRTPDGLADPEAALAALQNAVSYVESNFGALDVAWGEIYRLKIHGQDLPASGADGELGVFRVLFAGPWSLGSQLDNAAQYPVIGGDGFVAVVEFGDGEMPQAQVLTAYGNASQASSPHRADQLPLFAAQQLREAWVTREAVEAHLREEETLTLP